MGARTHRQNPGLEAPPPACRGDPVALLAREYSGIADDYVRLWSPVIRPMALPLLARLPLGDARVILDVGTGTGALWDDIAAAAPGARIIGVDRAEGMLRAVRADRLGRVAVMDAQALGVRAASVDVALLAFVLFHLPEPARALEDVRGVLVPGGAVGVVIQGNDPGLPGMAIWREEMDAVGAGPDPRPAETMQHALMSTPEKLSGMLAAAGYGDVAVWARSFEQPFAVDDLITLALRCGLASRRLAGLDTAKRTQCEVQVRKRMAGLGPADLIHRPEVLYATARRAS